MQGFNGNLTMLDGPGERSEGGGYPERSGGGANQQQSGGTSYNDDDSEIPF